MESPSNSLRTLKMSKRTRVGKRLDAIAEELVHHQLVEEVENVMANTTDDALFVVDKPGTYNWLRYVEMPILLTPFVSAANKKRSKVQKQQNVSSNDRDAVTQSDKELVTSATELTKRVSKAKFLQPEEVIENEPSKNQQKLVKKHIAALERRNKTLQKLNQGKVKSELPSDIWGEKEEEKGNALTALPTPIKTPDTISTSAELFLTKKRETPKIVIGLASGNSYNPSVEAHQEAIEILTKAEEKALAERKVLRDEMSCNLYTRSIADAINDHGQNLLQEKPSGKAASNTTSKSETTPAQEEEQLDTSDEEEDASGPKLSRKERKKMNRALRKAALEAKEDVESAVAYAEEKAIQRRERREQRIREGEEKEEEEFLHKTYAYAPVLPVPLSEELTGSLRTMKPVNSTGLILDSMTHLVSTGQVHKRMSASGVIVQDEDEEGNVEVTVLSAAAQRAYKKIGKPWKMVEFPRRKGFAPAEQGVVEEEKKLSLLQ